MERVAVVGSPGAGKSTFARRLGHLLGLEVFHLDALFWRPGWQPTPREEWLRRVTEVAARDRWVIDGNYAATLEPRLRRADTVVWLDLPRLTCLWRAAARAVSWRGLVRPDMGPGCPEAVFSRAWLEFLWYVAGFPEAERPRLEAALAAHARGARVVRLSDDGAAARFLAEVRPEL